MHWECPIEGWKPHRARAERTANMPRMFVTLDVGKLTGWLNLLAPCRVDRRAYDAGRGAGWKATGRVAAAVLAACTRAGAD